MLKDSQKPMAIKLLKFVAIPFSGCHIWLGSTDKDGYGTIGRVAQGAGHLKAHREAYRLYKGDPGEKHVCHTCDTPSCINPDHLYLGDPAQNGLDKKNRGRARTSPQYGPKNGMYGRTGPLNPFYGKKHTDETKRKISATKKLRGDL
jgi:NUMOD3 motif/HNH endonuclease